MPEGIAGARGAAEDPRKADEAFLRALIDLLDEHIPELSHESPWRAAALDCRDGAREGLAVLRPSTARPSRSRPPHDARDPRLVAISPKA
jgi:hypothetical protein